MISLQRLRGMVCATCAVWVTEVMDVVSILELLCNEIVFFCVEYNGRHLYYRFCIVSTLHPFITISFGREAFHHFFAEFMNNTQTRTIGSKRFFRGNKN